MASTITFRLDRETDRILRELAPKGKRARSRLIRDALRTHWEVHHQTTLPSSWEIYKSLGLRPGVPRHDRARHIDELLKEKLRAKRRNGTL